MIKTIKIRRRTFLPVAALLLLAGFLLAQPGTSLVRADGSISGTVFRDFNENGVQDPNEPGIAGVTATAVTDSGDMGSATTANDGSYTITNSMALDLVGSEARVVFTLPVDGSLGFLQPTVAGGTTVQFVDINSGDATGVDVGFFNPAQYIGPSPQVVVSRFQKGENVTTTGQAVIRGHDYNANGPTVTLSSLANANQVGTIYGLANQPSSGVLFGSSYVRRGAGLGPTNNTGTIYKLTGTGAPQTFIDITAIVDTGANPHPNGGVFDFTVDSPTYPLVGKIGLGDLELSDDEQTLYTINLNEQELIIMPLTFDAGGQPVAPIAGAISQVTIDPPTGTCDASDWRPFALKYFDGELYVGGVCTAESLIAGLNPTTATFADVQPFLPQLDAFVLQFDPGTNSFTTILSIDLDYSREAVNNGMVSQLNDGEWLPWTSAWRPTWGAFSSSVGIMANPQPILSDIEFDGRGFMFLGFRDRFSDQAGETDVGPNNGAVTEQRFGADIMLACLDGSGNWQLESGPLANRGCTNGLTSESRLAPNPPSADANPGSPLPEFFHNEQYWPGGTAPAQYHDETFLGALAVLYGSGEVVGTKYDTFNTHEAGTIVFNTTNGVRNRAVRVYNGNNANTFGKAGGIGDVELLGDPAPLEIGNRVWADLDGNGIQDPGNGENGISGVEVVLYRDNGNGTYTRVGTSVTDINGQFLFNDANVTENGAPGLETNTTYVVRINNTAPITQPPVSLANLSPPNQGTNDLIDTDASLGDIMGLGINRPEIVVTTGGPGANNHTLDFGFNSEPTAVTLTDLNVVAKNPPTAVLASVLLLLLLSGALFFSKTRRRPD